MFSLKTITFLTLASTLVTAMPALKPRQGSTNQNAVCATCSPISGENFCDVTTSCITTGLNSYCACRAGYKAAEGPLDPNVQFRLAYPAFENRVFVPTGAVCDTLCDNPFAGPGEDGSCSEVILTTCAA